MLIDWNSSLKVIQNETSVSFSPQYFDDVRRCIFTKEILRYFILYLHVIKFPLQSGLLVIKEIEMIKSFQSN